MENDHKRGPYLSLAWTINLSLDYKLLNLEDIQIELLDLEVILYEESIVRLVFIFVHL